ncbi:hypothetical protein MFIFM68171_01724 [Madurella fahalii]|uniref:SRR1-like domain-containing protein n=1 Tax=Madurella fahalii TaxID=1157608 RepID=A0ABQ0G193_9PEZI
MAGQEGEWNQVKRKGRRLRNIPAPADAGADFPVEGIVPNPNPKFSVDDMWRYHKTATNDWQVLEWWERMKAAMELIRNQPGRPLIRTAVCLGPGPFEPSNGSAQARRTAHVQTAAFCFIVDHLKLWSGQDIRCVVQEPRFTQRDKEFCARLGLEVVDDPGAFALVDGNTLLFGIHMELDIYNQALTVLPGIYVGASLQEWEKVVDHSPQSEDPLAAFTVMDATYASYTFPDLDYMFSSTIMYCRR